MKLTTKFVENVTKAGKYYDQHGLFLHVRSSGAKKWLQRYTINGRRREVGLGSAKKSFNDLPYLLKTGEFK